MTTVGERLVEGLAARGVEVVFGIPGVHTIELYRGLASGAIRSGIEALLHRANLSLHNLDSILLAGGFGNYIRRENALRIGLLPPLHYLSIHFVGNASLTGAKRALLAQSELARVQTLLSRTMHVELAAEPGFADLFMEHMLFPEE